VFPLSTIKLFLIVVPVKLDVVIPEFPINKSLTLIGEQPYRFSTYKSVIQVAEVLPVNVAVVPNTDCATIITEGESGLVGEVNPDNVVSCTY
jgi:hypothetical protein